LPHYVTSTFYNFITTKTPELIVSEFGTHVMLDILVGGKLHLRYQSESRSSDRKTASEHGMNWAISRISGMNNSSSSTSERAKNYNESMYLETRGGSVRIAPIKGSITAPPTIDITPWVLSINEQNSQLIDFGSKDSLIPIYEFITDPAKKAAVKEYVEKYLKDHETKTEDVRIPIHRYYHSHMMDHTYSNTKHDSYGFTYEGIEFYAFNYKAPGTIPIHRYYNPGMMDHTYVPYRHDTYGFTYEGIEFWAYPKDAPGTNPIHRYYHAHMKDHTYVPYKHDTYGFTYEGNEFNAFKTTAKEAAQCNHSHEDIVSNNK
jgi:hypothetical protein